MEILKYLLFVTIMSTIIIPGGGGAGFGIVSLVGNLVALFIIVSVVKYFWKKVEFPSSPINVVSELKKYNIDAEGLFAPKETYFMKPYIPDEKSV